VTIARAGAPRVVHPLTTELRHAARSLRNPPRCRPCLGVRQRPAPVEEATEKLMKAVEGYLDQWKAHGEPLTAAYEWRFGRLLVIGVDQRSAGASGCSIDGLFRVLQSSSRSSAAPLVGGGRVFYRDSTGEVQSVERTSSRRCATRARSARTASCSTRASPTWLAARRIRAAGEEELGRWHAGAELAGHCCTTSYLVRRRSWTRANSPRMHRCRSTGTP
jgi:hypothetical protein